MLRAPSLRLLFCCLIPLGGHAEQPVSSDSWLDAIAGNLSIRDEKGKPLQLLSPEAYHAEFRYLQKKFHEIDLKGKPVKTDGWTDNIPEAEWPVMGVCYFAYACANFSQRDPAMRKDTLEEMRWAIEAIQTPRLSGFMKEHFGEPFGKDRINVAVFLHGHFLSAAIRYREVSGDPRYDDIIHRVAKALSEAFENSEQGILKSYKDMWWITDNLPALSSLCRYDRIFKTNLSSVKEKFLRNVKAYYLDNRTGLICTYVNVPKKQQIQGARGISVMYALHFLNDVDSDFAQDQYRRAKKYFIRENLGLAAAREFPEGVEGEGDVDSGPLILGLGPSASGFAIAASAIMKDDATTKRLLKASVLAGIPDYRHGELTYLTMPPVGQTIIFFGKSLNSPSPVRSRR